MGYDYIPITEKMLSIVPSIVSGPNQLQLPVKLDISRQGG